MCLPSNAGLYADTSCCSAVVEILHESMLLGAFNSRAQFVPQNVQFAFDPQALERFYGVHQDRHESLAVVDLLGSALDDPEGAVDHFVVFP